jgi:hypothetical protein
MCVPKLATRNRKFARVCIAIFRNDENAALEGTTAP